MARRRRAKIQDFSIVFRLNLSKFLLQSATKSQYIISKKNRPYRAITNFEPKKQGRNTNVILVLRNSPPQASKNSRFFNRFPTQFEQIPYAICGKNPYIFFRPYRADRRKDSFKIPSRRKDTATTPPTPHSIRGAARIADTSGLSYRSTYDQTTTETGRRPL